MFDERTTDELFGRAKAEQFEKWLEDHEPEIDVLIKLPPGQWDDRVIMLAKTAIMTQRVIIRVEQVKKAQRELRGS